MESINLIESFSEFKEIKNIDRATLMSIIEDVFRSMLLKKYGSDENFDIIVNPDRGDIEIWHNREVVDDEFAEDSFDYDIAKHIGLTEAKKIDADLELGEEITTPVKLEDFGRRAVLAVRQNLVSKILELEKDGIYKKYKIAENIVKEFAIETTKEAIKEELKIAQKVQSKLEDEQKSLEKDKSDLEGNIENYKSKIKKAEEDIVANKTDQEKKKTEIEAQKKIVEEVDKKLRAVE